MNDIRPLTLDEAQTLFDGLKYPDEVDEYVASRRSTTCDYQIVSRLSAVEVSAIVTYVRNCAQIGDSVNLANISGEPTPILDGIKFIGTSEECGPDECLNELTESRRA